MLLTVAIIGILAAIAVPAYNNYITRGKIKTVQADLIALSLNCENHYQRMLSYPSVNYANKTLIMAAFPSWGPASADADFGFSTADAAAGTTYTLVATGTAGGANGCIISLKQDGAKTITGCDYSGDWL